MNVRRIVLIVVVLLGLTALGLAVAAPMVFGLQNPINPIQAIAGY